MYLSMNVSIYSCIYLWMYLFINLSICIGKHLSICKNSLSLSLSAKIAAVFFEQKLRQKFDRLEQQIEMWLMAEEATEVGTGREGVWCKVWVMTRKNRFKWTHMDRCNVPSREDIGKGPGVIACLGCTRAKWRWKS